MASAVDERGGVDGGREEEVADPWDDSRFGAWTGARHAGETEPRAQEPGRASQAEAEANGDSNARDTVEAED